MTFLRRAFALLLAFVSVTPEIPATAQEIVRATTLATQIGGASSLRGTIASTSLRPPVDMFTYGAYGPALVANKASAPQPAVPLALSVPLATKEAAIPKASATTAALLPPPHSSTRLIAEFAKRVSIKLSQPFGPNDAPESLAQASLEIDPRTPHEPSPEDWRDHVIYSIMVDRFSRGPNAKPEGDPHDGRSRHGGNIPGMTQRLDYLKKMGVTTILLSPLTLTIPDVDAYHGYAPIHLMAIDPRLGTMADFKNLIKKAHISGLKVILDMVANHAGPIFEYRGNSQWSGTDIPKPVAEPWHFAFKPTELAAPEHFTRGGVIRNWSDPQQIIYGDFPPNFRHYATDNPATQDMLIHVANWWVKETDIDGLRLDAIKHVAPQFRRRFYTAVREYAAKLGKKNFLLLGEISSGIDEELRSYMGPGGLDSAYNYPAYRRENYALHGRAPTAELEDSVARNQAAFGWETASRLLRFLDNQDMSRFLRNGEPVETLKVAMAFMLFSTGIPMVYYGTEQAFRQAIDSLDPETPETPEAPAINYPDPWNREDMFAEGQFKSESSRGDKFDEASETYRLLSRLAEVRKDLPALRRGQQFQRWSDPYGPGIYAFSRIHNGQEVLVVLNTAAEPRSAEMWVDVHLTPPGAAVFDRLDSPYAIDAYASDGGSKVTVHVPAHGIRVLVKK